MARARTGWGRTATTTAALAILLAVVGAVSGPTWDPVPVPEQLRVPVTDTAITGADDATPVGTYDVVTERAEVRIGGDGVDATVRAPADLGGTPGVVFVHGAGTKDAETAFAAQAAALASAGITSVVVAKRPEFSSLRHRDYAEMARDYAVAVAYLRTLPGVDPERVGLYAESEGTWIAPLMARDDPTLAFVALVSAPVVPPRAQAAFAVDNYLRNTGVPESVFRAIPRAVGMELPGGGIDYADFDVDPFLPALQMPVLLVYGTDDSSMPVVQGTRDILAALTTAGNPDVLVRFYGGANHGIKVDGALVPVFARDLTGWILGLPGTASNAPRVAGAEPFQRYLALDVPAPHWFGSGDTVAVIVLVGLGLLVVGASVATVTSLRDRRRGLTAGERGTDPVVARQLVVVPVLALATLGGLVAYLVAIARLAVEYERDAWVVWGGWFAVRLVGIAVLVAAAVLVERVIDHRAAVRAAAESDGTPPATLVRGRLAHAATAATLSGTVVVVLLLAYWGVYQLGI
ncbi:S9 family peptidase [Sanguibacter sp. HDW7]|uniref:alpha/beta hydrolase family protein n=1 Tax=Sanguibacter sp. HDW7 TaxID=2714931 RepID=UPI00140BB80A|nr:prolyl oligopeptidase family serine peptidase [Sanguibacter sp. HDW7]QIK83807.1 prolyl oligopeptidase family serine peptidase [Sanguibacter sp. HDW7]